VINRRNAGYPFTQRKRSLNHKDYRERVDNICVDADRVFISRNTEISLNRMLSKNEEPADPSK
jgi:hypothetical protein